MNRDKILELLSLLNDKLKRDGIRGEIALYGGAVMCLCLNARGSTHDLDALFEPKSKIYQLAAEIAEEESIRKDWLNDAVKGFISTNDTMDLYDSLSNLDIYTTKYEYFFAMKCMSCRLNEDSSDEDDIRFLINYLNIKDINEAENIILKYFPVNLLVPKTHFMLEEFFNK